MSNGLQSEMECSQFEALLAEALDGALAAQIRPKFEEHGRNCGCVWSHAGAGAGRNAAAAGSA